MSTTLFTLPISATGGSITCTLPKSDTHKATYLLTWVSGPDNRLVSSFIDAYLLALDIIQTKYPPGVVISTSGITKFFSNGLDLEHAASIPYWFRDSLGTLMRRLLTYPMPTIALINGHAFAGGFIISMCHDYRIMNPSKGFLCMNEIEFGAPLSPQLTSIFRTKLATAKLYQTVVLESHRFPGTEALKEGIVDGLGGLDEVLALITKLGLEKRALSGVWGTLRREMWRTPYTWVKDDDGFAQSESMMEKGGEVAEKDRQTAEDKVAKWEAAGRSKL